MPQRDAQAYADALSRLVAKENDPKGGK